MSKSVVVYSKPNCMQCLFTKKFLDEHHIAYTEKDVTASNEALNEVKEMGFRSLPVISVEGETPFYGFNPDLLESITQ